MVFFEFLKSDPISYFVILGVIEAILILIYCFIFRVTITWIEVAVSFIGCAAIGTVGFYTADLQLGGLVLYLGMSFILLMIISKGEPLVSLGGTLLMFGILVAGSVFLVYPNTPLNRSEIGGATLFIHNYQTYELPSEIPFLDTQF